MKKKSHLPKYKSSWNIWKEVDNPGPFYFKGSLHYVNKEGNFVHAGGKEKLKDIKPKLMNKTEFKKMFGHLLKRKNPEPDFSIPKYNYIEFLSFKIVFSDKNSNFSINKLESVLTVAYEKLKLKFPKLLKLSNFPKLFISGRHSGGLFYNTKENILMIPLEILREFDKYTIAKSFIHEIGHFIYYKILTEEQRNMWDEYYFRTLKQVNINTYIKILDKYSGKEIKEKYPILYYQLISLYNSKNLPDDLNIFENGKFKEWVTQNNLNDTIVTVSKKPISYYISSIQEDIALEAFAEIFAYYVYYGERYILTDNIKMFNYVISL